MLLLIILINFQVLSAINIPQEIDFVSFQLSDLFHLLLIGYD